MKRCKVIVIIPLLFVPYRPQMIRKSSLKEVSNQEKVHTMTKHIYSILPSNVLQNGNRERVLPFTKKKVYLRDIELSKIKLNPFYCIKGSGVLVSKRK